ncbi:uncharacterized protein TNCV_4160651 [Trichonephila clavipes]|nr:uncharacterized protein TNCV_4160651 [Trichonephila clavipes]
MSSSPVPLKVRRVGERCLCNLSRPQTCSRWCGVVDSRGDSSSGVVLVTIAWFKIKSVRKQIVMASKRKHSTLTLKDKLEVLKRLDKGEGVTKLATEFNVGKATICDWRKNRRKLEQYCANSSGETLFFWRNIHRFSSLKL